MGAFAGMILADRARNGAVHRTTLFFAAIACFLFAAFTSVTKASESNLTAHASIDGASYRSSGGNVASGGSYNYAPTVMADGVYKMWWCAGIAGDHILYAESSSLNGPFHAPGSGAPYLDVLQPSPGSQFDGSHTCDPSVIRVGGTYYMYYGGITEGGSMPTQIGVASSTNGTSWTKLNNGNPIVTPRNPAAGGYGAGQPSAAYLDGYFYMMYTDSSGLNGGLQYAIRSTDPTFQNNVEVATGAGFVPRTAANTASYVVSNSISPDWQFSDTLNAWIVLSNQEAGVTFVRFLSKDLSRVLRPDLGITANWMEGPGLVSTPEKRALSGSDCQRIPLDFINATAPSFPPTNLQRYGADLLTNSGCYRFMRGFSSGTGISSWRTALSMSLPPHTDAGDFNGDGKADLVVADPEANGTYHYKVALGNGAASVSWLPVISGMALPAAMAVGDVSGDGKADIVAAEPEGNGKYRYMFGISNGAGIATWNKVMSGMGLPRSMSIDDFNGDGKADIVAAESEGSNGKYRYAVGISNGSGIGSWSVVMTGMSPADKMEAADFNGDGKADIVAAEPEGNGQYRYGVGISNGSGVASWNVVKSAMSPSERLDAADFNGDGKADIIAGEYESNGNFRYAVGISNGSGIASWSVVLSGLSPTSAMEAGDFTGDGKADLVDIEYAGFGSHRYMLGVSNGTGISSWGDVIKGMRAPSRTSLGDFTGDGKADVISVEPDDSQYRYMVGVTGGDGTLVKLNQVLSGMGLPTAMEVGDVNKDGKADIVAAEPEGNGKYRYMFGISNGSGISSWSQVMTGMSAPDRFDASDFNGDGKADIVVAESEGNGKYRYAVGISNGSGIASWSVVMTGMSAPDKMSAKDFNGDGKADLMVAEAESKSKYRYAVGISNGSGIGSWSVVMTGMSPPSKMDDADFNGDGKADIVVAESEGNGKYRYAVGISNGSGIGSWSVVMTSMMQPFFFNTGDLDANGKADIVSVERK